MLNPIDFDKGILLHVISVRIIVSRSIQYRTSSQVKTSRSRFLLTKTAGKTFSEKGGFVRYLGINLILAKNLAM